MSLHIARSAVCISLLMLCAPHLYGSNGNSFSYGSAFEADIDLSLWRYHDSEFQMRAEETQSLEDEIVTKFRASDKHHQLDIQINFDYKKIFDRPETFEYEDDFGYNKEEEQLDHYNAKRTKIRYSQQLNGAWAIESSLESGHGLKNELQFRPNRKLKLQAGWGSNGDLLRKASYKFAKNWQLIAKWNTQPRPTYSSDEFGGEVRFKGFDEFFVPSAGVTKKSKNHDKSYKDYSQNTLWVETELKLSSAWWFDTKYEFYHKDYVTADPTGKYFGRQDKYKQFSFSITNRAHHMDWGLKYKFENLNSIDLGRDETSHDIRMVVEARF